MAETEELRQMVLSFRRAELIELLGFVGLNKMGVKATLLQRAVSLVQSQRGCSVPVQIKIRDLYRTIHNPYSTETTRTSRAGTRSQQVADARRRYSQGKAPTSPHSPSNTPSSHSSAVPVDYTKSSSNLPSGHSDSSVIPVHPDVRFKRLPFYDIMGELLKPTSLVPRGPSRYQQTYFVFHLTPQQAQDIAMSRDFRPSAKFEYMVQIQLRFCFLETTCEQEDNFPPSICVRVNSKMAQLPNPIPTTKPGVEPKRPGRPVDITSLCRISPTMPNHVEISWASEYGRGYCVSINLVKRMSSDTLLQRLKQFGNRHADHTRALIKEKLQHDPDSEIATTSLRISLVCPLGKMRMNMPCRATTCTHLQCFDAVTFLMMNEKKPTWNCPVCDKPTPFHKLTIDGLFVEILKKVTDVDEIQFLEDGSWGPIRNTKDTHIISSPALIKSHPIDDNEVNLCTDSSISVQSSSSSSASPAKKPKMEVIDLTLTDSEDDEPTRPESSHNISSGCVSPPVISIDSPAGPQSVSSVSSSAGPQSVSSLSSLESPIRTTSRSFSPISSCSLLSLSSSSSPSSCSSSSSLHSSSTVNYNLPQPQSPMQSPASPDTPTSPLMSPRSPYRSPYRSPLPSSVSPRASPHPMSPISNAVAFYPPFPTVPAALTMPSAYFGMNPALDGEIEEFLQGLATSDPFRSSTPCPDLSSTPVMIPSPASVASTASSGVSVLPPMPPLLSYQKTVESANSAASKHSGLSLNSTSVPGVFASSNKAHSNGSHSNSYNRLGAYCSPAKREALSPTDAHQPSWLTALSSAGHKRPPPAHSNCLPPAKRIHLEKASDSPASSNSMDSPLVDYDSLCNLLDSDRNEEMNNVLGFPADFPLSAQMSSSSHSRNIYNISPSDVISLD